MPNRYQCPPSSQRESHFSASKPAREGTHHAQKAGANKFHVNAELPASCCFQINRHGS